MIRRSGNENKWTLLGSLSARFFSYHVCLWGKGTLIFLSSYFQEDVGIMGPRTRRLPCAAAWKSFVALNQSINLVNTK
jgi:hypothetical protein